MKLNNLLSIINNTNDYGEIEITHIAQDTRNVKPGALFVCIVGLRSDGHSYAKQAVEKGAVAVVCQKSVGVDCEIIVEDTRIVYSLLCREFWNNPNNNLTMIAVTGTNGKTTVTNLIKQILEKSGSEVGLIGTIKNEICGVEIPAKYTTPDPFELYALLARAVKAGCKYVVMEASSQALDQLRLYGLQFKIGVFTNLTQDHLDYHKTLENYFLAKASLFEQVDCAILNLDDDYALRIADNFKGSVIGFSIKNDQAQFRANSVELSATGVSFKVKLGEDDRECFTPMLGEFSVYNAIAAAATANTLGVDNDTTISALLNSKGVYGRSELLFAGEYSIICDYAHTADGLKSFLSSIKPFVSGRLIVLFGCAGERDAEKRPGMGNAVADYCDFAVVTSDNPRSEDADKIISDITPIFDKRGVKYIAHADRRYAINSALSMLKKNDVLALCGKGHEDYQVVDGITLYLNEHKIVEEFVKGVSIGEDKA